MARYDLELVRAVANGRWVEILSTLGGVSADLLDGRHHGCPKQCHPDAGGKDRFRLIDAQAGACHCNQCFSSKNGDGFAALGWLTGDDFPKTLEAVAKHCGIKPEKKKKADPAEHLEWLMWNDTTIGLWCESKQPIIPDAIKQVGGRLAKYRGEYTVIAIPVWGPAFDAEDPRGWALYRADGGMLPRYTKKGEQPEFVKIKLTAGSDQGVIGDPKQCSALAVKPDTSATTDHSPAASDATVAATWWWKVEGVSDLLTMLSMPFPPGHQFLTTANGAMEQPLDWIVELFAGLNCYVLHDSDLPGQRGATWVEQRTGQKRPGWCPRLAERAAEVRNVVLPFAVEPTHGPDVRDFFKGGGTVQSLLERAEEAQVFERPVPGSTAFVEEAEDDPSRLAKVNIENYRRQGRDLVQWRGEWYQYKGRHYTRLTREDLEPRIFRAVKGELDKCWIERKDKEARPVAKVSGRLVSDVIKATAAESYLKGHQELNSWIDGGPEDCVAMRNGILCLSELFKPPDERDNHKILLPHNSKWFSTSSLPYDFDPNANCQAWIEFLNDVFNGDEESIRTLQQWFGLMLTPITSYQKMLFVIGQPRSGKGTIMRTMIDMLGRSSVASPSLNEFAGQFALHGLLDKTVVVIPDARLSARADTVAITERLLSITGEDPQDIQRKYLGTLHNMKLQVRFTLFSNVLPKLSDTSSAFMSRGIFLSMPNSYQGREDLGLSDRLYKELPGILNWAIAGRFDLLSGNRLRQPASGQRLVDEMRMAISPVAAFLEESCDRTGDVGTKDLFDAFCQWSSENDQVLKMDISAFSKRVRDVLPNIERRRLSMGGSRAWRLIGISLKNNVTYTPGFSPSEDVQFSSTFQ